MNMFDWTRDSDPCKAGISLVKGCHVSEKKLVSPPHQNPDLQASEDGHQFWGSLLSVIH